MTADLEEVPSAAEIYAMLKGDLHSEHPWEVQHHPEHSEIEAYITIPVAKPPPMAEEP